MLVFVALRIVHLTAALGRAMRGETMFASGVLTVLVLIVSGYFVMRSMQGTRERTLFVATAGMVLFGIGMIITTMTAGEPIEPGESVHIEWTGKAADDHPLLYNVLVSADGVDWSTVVFDGTENKADLEVKAGTRVRVIGTDGSRSAEASLSTKALEPSRPSSSAPKSTKQLPPMRPSSAMSWASSRTTAEPVALSLAPGPTMLS